MMEEVPWKTPSEGLCQAQDRSGIVIRPPGGEEMERSQTSGGREPLNPW